MTAHQKFREAEKAVRSLPSLASEVGMTEYEERLALLKDLRDIWAAGGTAILQRADPCQMEGKVINYNNIMLEDIKLCTMDCFIQLMLGLLTHLEVLVVPINLQPRLE